MVLANGRIRYNTIVLPIPTFNHYGKFGKFGISDFGTFVTLPDPEHSPEEALLSYRPSPVIFLLFLSYRILKNPQSP